MTGDGKIPLKTIFIFAVHCNNYYFIIKIRLVISATSAPSVTPLRRRDTSPASGGGFKLSLKQKTVKSFDFTEIYKEAENPPL